MTSSCSKKAHNTLRVKMAGTPAFSFFLLSWAFLVTQATPSPTTPPQSSSSCPKQCKCTDDDRTVDCSKRGFFRLPSLPRNVTKLDLSGNLLGPMTNGSFEHLRHLEEVDLSDNGFLRLQLCTFTGLLHLKRVDLHGNRLSSLPSSLFADNGELEVLDLSHNQMDALPDLLLHSIPLLKVLNVSHNQATHLKLGLRFQLLTQIRHLDISHNPFTNASQDAFEMTETWDHLVPRSLDLSYCQLQNIHPQALQVVPGLRNLSLSGNGLLSFRQVVDVLKQLENSGLEVADLSNMTVSDPGVFSEVRLMALRELDLSENLIDAVPAATFGNIRSLQRLDISQNLLTSLEVGFEDLVNLVELNISHCRLSSFKGTPVGRMEHLTSLDLSHNRLLEATEVDLSALRHLRMLDLSFNTLQSVVLPGDSSHLVTLSFASNALTSLPSMPNMRSLRHFSAHDNNLQSLSGFLFTEARRILTANFSQNDLATIDHRAFLPVSPEVIDLSLNFLTETHYFSWTTTKEIYLHSNKLNNLDQQTFYGMDQMRVLDLRHNNLSVINDDVFKFLSNLTTLTLANNSLQMTEFFHLFRSLESLQDLDLDFNHIEEINITSFQPLVSIKSLSLRKNRMKVIPAELFQHLAKLEEVDVSGNPFDCDCELLPLQEWLKETKIKVVQRFDLNLTNTCVSPPEHRGKLVTAYTVKQFQCNTKMLYMIIFGSVGALGIIVGVISSLVCHYYRKWHDARRREDPRYRHRRKSKDDNPSRKEKNSNKVDLVRVSKRSDPYGKQELVNGWVASKQFTTAKKNSDFQVHKKHQQGPPRPPWPERQSGRSKKEQKGWKEKHRDKDEEHHSRRDSEDRRIRSISEMIPLRASQNTRLDRARSLVPYWDNRYYDKYPPVAVNLKRLPDRWEDMEAYPTWNPTQVKRMMYNQDDRRYYTLPYPAQRPRYTPYGPDYPYGRARSEEEEFRRARQPRALPYPPRDQDLNNSDSRPPNGYRNNYPTQNPYPSNHHRDYENPRDCREDIHRNGREGTNPRVLHDPRYNHHEYENTRLLEERGKDRTRDEEKHDAADQTIPMKRGTSDVQIHRRDSEYRSAMDNQVVPKAKSTPLLAEDKASDWL